MDTCELNEAFGIAGELEFKDGAGGFPVAVVENERASARISVYAGQVLAYQPVDEPEDLLFVSERAYFRTGKAIKGGIPICWPWFGAHPQDSTLPAHGFARNHMWEVTGAGSNEDGDTWLTLMLEDREDSRALWPQPFELELSLTISDTLELALTSRNTGAQPFIITQALHSYFNIGDISRVQVSGLEGCSYLDKAADGREVMQHGTVTVVDETDRIYTGVPTELVIDDAALERRIHISSAGSHTAVVWNPWKKIAAAMDDLDDEDYRKFICVETTNAAGDQIEVAPGDEYRLRATYSIVR